MTMWLWIGLAVFVVVLVATPAYLVWQDAREDHESDEETAARRREMARALRER